ncbi:hypothetical protein J6590_069765 [Homalodisca vitripennis]|nr:hypothetical protein J6590_069765 [Homalodisca vitripennis]
MSEYVVFQNGCYPPSVLDQKSSHQSSVLTRAINNIRTSDSRPVTRRSDTRGYASPLRRTDRLFRLYSSLSVEENLKFVEYARDPNPKACKAIPTTCTYSSPLSVEENLKFVEYARDPNPKACKAIPTTCTYRSPLSVEENLKFVEYARDPNPKACKAIPTTCTFSSPLSVEENLKFVEYARDPNPKACKAIPTTCKFPCHPNKLGNFGTRCARHVAPKRVAQLVSLNNGNIVMTSTSVECSAAIIIENVYDPARPGWRGAARQRSRGIDWERTKRGLPPERCRRLPNTPEPVGGEVTQCDVRARTPPVGYFNKVVLQEVAGSSGLVSLVPGRPGAYLDGRCRVRGRSVSALIVSCDC